MALQKSKASLLSPYTKPRQLCHPEQKRHMQITAQLITVVTIVRTNFACTEMHDLFFCLPSTIHIRLFLPFNHEPSQTVRWHLIDWRLHTKTFLVDNGCYFQKPHYPPKKVQRATKAKSQVAKWAFYVPWLRSWTSKEASFAQFKDEHAEFF